MYLIVRIFLVILFLVIPFAILLIGIWRRDMNRFRERIRQGDHVKLRVKNNFIVVVVLRKAAPGTLLVKQFGNGIKTGRPMLVSLKNCYPA